MKPQHDAFLFIFIPGLLGTALVVAMLLWATS